MLQKSWNPSQYVVVLKQNSQALEETLKNDREAYECVQKLNQIMGKMNKK